MNSNRILIRDIQYRSYIEHFIISAIVAILGIRVFLIVTKYPTIGGDLLHISHMLWGGLLMLIALFSMFIFLNTEMKRVATIIGGLGFGTFIDEIGKFITLDNNYFFKPSFALIYVLFVLIYLASYLISRRKEFTEKEYLINSLEMMKDAVINDLDVQEKQKAMYYLSRADTSDSITKTIQGVYKHIDALPTPKPSFFHFVQGYAKDKYISIVHKSWFQTTLVLFFLLQAIVSLIIAGLLIIEKNTFIFPAFLLSHGFTSKSFNVVHFYSTLASVVFIFFGIYKMRTSRLEGYILFKRSILISVLLAQVFAFYFDPTRAFATLIFNILILATLNYMIENERALKEEI